MEQSRSRIVSNHYFHNELYIVQLSPQQSSVHGKEAVLLLHGFPGWINKNYDIAERLTSLGYTVFLPHYRGLGHSKGRFSFEASITDIEELVDSINAQFRPTTLSILGHSWGGLVASLITPKNLKKTCLLAPLINAPDHSTLTKITTDLVSDYSDDCDSHTPESLATLFRGLIGKISMKDLTERAANNQLVIFHGSQDAVIDLTLSKQLVQTIPKIRLNIIVDDHSFSKNRRQFLSLIEDEFQIV